jgi:uncharacterized membrane protein HdeD (DUF308 family)
MVVLNGFEFRRIYIMRTLMLIASVAMIGSGVFCVANGSAAFLTVAFIIGLVYLLMGATEILVGLRADFDVSEKAVSITKDGILMLIFGAVIITGQVTDDTAARILIAAWLAIEGVLAFSTDRIDLMHITTEERIEFGVNAVMLLFGLYMFFNNVLFGLCPKCRIFQNHQMALKDPNVASTGALFQDIDQMLKITLTFIRGALKT